MSYYNTTNETQSQVDLFTEANKTQDEVIKGIIDNYKGTFTPRIIFRLCPSTYELTSVRRALHTFKKEGYIFETGKKITGSKNRPELELKKI